MKRLSIFFAALLLSASSMMAAETVVYTVTATHGTSTGYATNCDITVDGITWNVEGNTNMTGTASIGGWGLGGKNINGAERIICSKNAIKGDITKIVVTHKTNNGITINNFHLLILSQVDDLNNPDAVVYATTEDIASMTNSNAVVTFSAPEGQSWTNKYYAFVYDLTNTTTSNKRIEFSSAAFYEKVQDITATAIALDKVSLTLGQYKSETLVATLTPANATTDIVWTSDNETIATVNNGVITAVGMGQTTITATAGTLTARCQVTVTETTPITCAQAVEIAQTVTTNTQAAAGGKYVIHGYVTEYKGTPANDMAKYTNYSAWLADTPDGGQVFMAYQVKPTDGETVANIGDYVEVIGDITQYNGTYETKGKGTATIRVIPAPQINVESITLSETAITLTEESSTTLVATVLPENATNKNIIWTSDNEEVATVSNGVVTTHSAGVATITATTEDGGLTATCVVTVDAYQTFYSVDFTNAAEAQTWNIDNKSIEGVSYVWSQTTSYGMKASAYANTTNYATESWLISPVIDLSLAKSANLYFSHARKYGSLEDLSVMATTDGFVWFSLAVSQWPDGSSWDFVDAEADLTNLLGSSHVQIAFSYTSTTSRAATWEIKNMKVSGIQAYAPATSLTLSEALTMQQYKSVQLAAVVVPSYTTDAVVWASDNEQVATVSERGVITALATGSANITVTAGTLSATCAVTVVESTPISCARAVEIAQTVSVNGGIAAGGKYVIRGYVTEYNGVPSDNMETYNNYSAWLADTQNGGQVFMAYQVVPADGTTIANIGDYVEVIGDITQYNGTYETAGRGTATIRVITSVSTDTDNAMVQTAETTKILSGGQVIIIRSNKAYNLLGQEISK